MEITDIQKIELKDGDLLVIKVPDDLGDEQRSSMADVVQKLLSDGVACLIYDERIDLELYRKVQ